MSPSGASVEPGLLCALADTGHRGVRWSALACAELGFRRPVPLITALLEHPDPMVREGACEALGRFEEPAALPALAARLNDETDWYAAEQPRRWAKSAATGRSPCSGRP
ncbi:HEAT repeat domain-containing protein [Streptomyces erythrochromogenes]|uniref:HEAT repeat domain-containing protein n=1 Tax=Streptomyces erythrochromogenes TaxID=285574 RepID=UPI003674FB6B